MRENYMRRTYYQDDPLEKLSFPGCSNFDLYARQSYFFLFGEYKNLARYRNARLACIEEESPVPMWLEWNKQCSRQVDDLIKLMQLTPSNAFFFVAEGQEPVGGHLDWPSTNLLLWFDDVPLYSNFEGLSNTRLWVDITGEEFRQLQDDWRKWATLTAASMPCRQFLYRGLRYKS